MGGSDLSLFFCTSLQSQLDIHSYFDILAKVISYGSPHLQEWTIFLYPATHVVTTVPATSKEIRDLFTAIYKIPPGSLSLKYYKDSLLRSGVSEE